MSLSNWAENEIADWAAGNGQPTAITEVWVKLHIGDPGEDCTGNPAAHTTRVEATFSAASGGIAVNDADIEFEDMEDNEEITHASVWDDETAGNPIAYDAVVDPQNVEEGGSLTIPAGDLRILIT